MLDIFITRLWVELGHSGWDDAGKYTTDIIKEYLISFTPVKRLDQRAAQRLVAAVSNRVGVITDTFVRHVEVGVDQAGVFRGFEVIQTCILRTQGQRFALAEDIVKLTDRHLDEMQFPGGKSIPACGIFSDKFYLKTIYKRRGPALQYLQTQLTLTAWIITFFGEVKGFFAKIRVGDQHGTCAIPAQQFERAGTDRVAGELLAIFFNSLPGYHRRKALCQRMSKLRVRPRQTDLQGIVIRRLQTGNVLIVIGALCFPLIQTLDVVLP